MRNSGIGTVRFDSRRGGAMIFRLPELGEAVREAELVRWLVETGQSVRAGDPLAEVMTDKATTEVPAPFAGVIESLGARPGDVIKIGEPFLTYRPAGSGAAGGSSAGVSGGVGGGGGGGVVGGDVEIEVEEVGEDRGEDSGSGRDSEAGAGAGAGGVGGGRRIPASPTVRAVARELGMELGEVRATGEGGRVLLKDLVAAYRERTAAEFGSRGSASLGAGISAAPPHPAVVSGPVSGGSAGSGASAGLSAGAGSSAPVPPSPKAGDRIPFQGLRRQIAERMSAAKREVPHASYVEEAEVTELVRLREELRGPMSARGVKLTYLPFFVKATARALRDVPLMNSSLDGDDGVIRLHEACHVGVAVAARQGLLVPVIRDADRRSVADIARAIERLSVDARENRVRLDDLRGATFTITSIGNLGGLFSAPVVTPPQVGILGLGRIVKRPVYDANDVLRPAHLVYLSVSFDHRVLDGATVTAFGNALAEHLRKPATLLCD